MKFPVLIIASYMLGSIPFGLIIAKAHGKNLFEIGSGNIGATNLARAVGKKWAYFCFVLDVAKGAIPVIVASNLIPNNPNAIALTLVLAVGIASVLGHIFSIYIKFKGGKGVATSFGIALGFWPYYTVCALIAFGLWIATVVISRYISLASIIASITFPISLAVAILINNNWNFSQLWPLQIAAVAIPAVVILRHKDNIRRIINSTESKIFSKS